MTPNKWLERTSLRRRGSCGCGWQQPRRLRSPVSHTVSQGRDEVPWYWAGSLEEAVG